MIGPDSYYAIRVLGSLAMRADGQVVQLTPGRRVTLAKLVAGGPDGVDARAFLGDGRPIDEGERAKVRMAVSRLRATGFPSHWVVSEGGRYRLDLPVEAIDAWHLLHVSGTGAIPGVDILARLLTPRQPLEDVGSSELLDEFRSVIRTGQRRVLERLRTERPDLLGRYAETLVGLVRDEPFDEQLVAFAASTLAEAGRRRDALGVIRATHRGFAELGLSVGREVADIERRILRVDDAPVSHNLPTSAPGRDLLPAPLRSRLEGPRVGPRATIDRLIELSSRQGGGLGEGLVTGPVGAGKSRLLADAAQVLNDRGWRVLFAGPSPATQDVPYAALLTALGDAATPLLEELSGSVERHRLRHFKLLSDAFARFGIERKTVLVVDDAQWIDRHSAAFLVQMKTLSPTGLQALWIGGRPDGTDEGDQRWAMIRSSLDSAGAVTIEVQPFGVEAMEQFVAARHPKMRRGPADKLARELHIASAGLPGVAAPLLASLSQEDLLLARLGAGTEVGPLDQLVSSLSLAVQLTGFALAVVDVPCTAEDVASVVAGTRDEIDVATMLDALAELVDRELVVAPEDHIFELGHLLIWRAFDRIGTGARRAQMHLAAAETFSSERERSAWHRWLAVPLVPLDDAAGGLIESACRLATQGAHARAADLFGRVNSVAPSMLTPAHRGTWARSLDLAGARDAASSTRQAAFDMAVAAQSWNDALFIATSGLPETEAFDGDRRLVEQLRLIPADGLDDGAKWRLLLHRARQETLLGEPTLAQQLTGDDMVLAADPTRRVELALCRRLAAAVDPPTDRLRALALATNFDLAQVSEELRAEYLVNLAVDRFESGDTRGAGDALESISEQERLTGRRRWYIAMLEATLAAERGEASAASLRQKAYDVGLAAGVGEADNGLLIAEFAELWISGGHGALLPMVEAGSIGTEAVLVSSAAAASVCLAAGRTELAREYANVIRDAGPDLPAAGGAAAAALAADVMRESNDAVGAEVLARTLRRRSSSLILVGAGAACVGPSDRYLARLIDDNYERVLLLQQAIELCRSAGLSRWEHLCRSDLEQLEAPR